MRTNISLLSEPKLQFGASKHIDIRFGLRDYGPFDSGSPRQPQRIRIGIVGTPETTEKLAAWLDRLQGGVPAKDSKFENRYVAFPGFGTGHTLSPEISVLESATATIPPRQIKSIIDDHGVNLAIEHLADLFFEELEHLSSSRNVDVIFCAAPEEVYMLRHDPREHEKGEVDKNNLGIANDDGEIPPRRYSYRVDFHDLLKAQSLLLSTPTQFIWPPTYTGEKTEIPGRQTYPLQDEATRAWNLYVALYYKAGGVPWRLVRNRSDFESCFVGISFYKSLDEEQAHGSVAQIFNERGEGLIMQGGSAKRSGKDRQLHLNGSDAEQLLTDTLQVYRREHGHPPARLVVHKTSPFSEEEKAGLWNAADTERIEFMDLLHVRESKTRLFRKDYHVPLRGTFANLDRTHNHLYTVGSVNFYQMTMSNHVPKTLQFSMRDSSSSPTQLAEEILKLTKMNWNNTQISQMMPVTIEAARHVGDLLKYANREGIPAQALASEYSYYM